MPDADPRKRLREIRDIQLAAAALTSERDRLLREAVEAGHSRRKLSKDVGLSRSRVGQIVDE